MASLYFDKRYDLWFLQWTDPDTGKRKTRSLKTANENEARMKKLLLEQELLEEQLAISRGGTTVGKMLDAYQAWAVGEAGFRNLHRLNRVIERVREIMGDAMTNDVMTQDLVAVRDSFQGDGLMRTTINSYLHMARAIFKWGVEHGYLDGGVVHNLEYVSTLKKGRTIAPESEKRPAAPLEDVRKAQAMMPSVLRTLVEVQLNSGARPGEVVDLRPCDIETETNDDGSEDWWVDLSKKHKNAWRGQSRILLLGPKCQEALKPLLDGRDPEAFIFDPREAVRERAEQRSNHRKPDQRPTPRETGRRIGEHYTTASYRRAIETACKKAKVPVWTPHQLRHLKSDELYEATGGDWEAARVYLGHSTVNTTQLYVNMDFQAARKIARQFG